jgi:hypothetical protein
MMRPINSAYSIRAAPFRSRQMRLDNFQAPHSHSALKQ